MTFGSWASQFFLFISLSRFVLTTRTFCYSLNSKSIKENLNWRTSASRYLTSHEWKITTPWIMPTAQCQKCLVAVVKSMSWNAYRHTRTHRCKLLQQIPLAHTKANIWWADVRSLNFTLYLFSIDTFVVIVIRFQFVITYRSYNISFSVHLHLYFISVQLASPCVVCKLSDRHQNE